MIFVDVSVETLLGSRVRMRGSNRWQGSFPKQEIQVGKAAHASESEQAAGWNDRNPLRNDSDL